MNALDETRAPRPAPRLRLATLMPAILLGYFVLLWPLVYARGAVTADLTAGPMPEAQPYLLNRVFFPAMAVTAILLLVAERRRLARFHPAGLVVVGGLFGYLGLTALWALAPAASFSKWLLLAMQTLALLPAVLIARRVDDLVRPMFWVMVATLGIDLVAVVALPPTPIGHAAIYSHKNTLGGIAVLGGFFALYGATRGDRRTRTTALAMLPVVLVLLLASRSKTSLGLFLVVPIAALVVVGLRRLLRFSIPVVLVVVAVPVVFLLAGGFDGISFQDLSRLVSGDDTFTGRTELWRFVWSQIGERPIAGYGYQSFWGIGEASPAAAMPDGFLQRTPHAHNGYLDLLLQGGIVAAALFLAALLMVARWIDRLVDVDLGIGFFVTTVLVYMMALDLLETDWLQGLSGSGMLMSLSILLAAVEWRGRAPT
jgi:O-antigen ligase